MSDLDMSAYLGVFLDEVNEQLQILDEEVVNLENNSEDTETIQKIFRAAHTLKGSSAAMGFENMKELTHKIENVFDLIRTNQLTVTKEIINVILNSIDYIKELKEAIINGTLESTDIGPYHSQLEKLKESANKISQINTIEDEEEKYQTVVDDIEFPEVIFDDYQRDTIEKALESGFKVMTVSVSLVKTAMLKSVRAFLIHNNLKEVGEIIASYPSTEELEDDAIFNGNLVFILVTTSTKQAIISTVNVISDINTVSITLVDFKNIEDYCKGKKLELSNQIKKQREKNIIPSEKIKIQPTVRVDVSRLEHLINLVGELVIDQTRLVELKNRLSDQFPNNSDVELFSEVSNHLNQVVSDLQEGMMKTRMLPIEQLFNRFPRMVRDTSIKANKEIDFIIEGKETELDRNLIEEIGDPIIHLLRNSIDHGIEEPEQREKLGKPRKGTVLLKASHEENHIVITISDDGRGIDPEKIKKSAIQKGFITSEEAHNMLEKELIFLIFKSGVSTAKNVTDISGRGVGMDIVRSHIEKLNGMVDIESTVGVGTTFTIKLPLTLAIIRSLLVHLGTKQFAIPLANVQEIVRLDKTEIKTIKNQEVGVVRGRVLPLVRLHGRLNVSEKNINQRKRLFLVIVGLAEKRVGIIVDKTLGNQEIVIKSMGKYIGNPKYIAGATIMGDGNVALILDAGSIVREEGSSDLANQNMTKEITEIKDETIHLTTFRLGCEEYGIEINRVKDIINVPEITKVMNSPHSVLGMVNLRGKLIPVVNLREQFSIDKSNSSPRKSRIVVVELEKEWTGILVDEVTEVIKVERSRVESALENVSTVQSKYIKGICNLGERLVVLLDIELVLEIEELNQSLVENDLVKLNTGE